MTARQATKTLLNTAAEHMRKSASHDNEHSSLFFNAEMLDKKQGSSNNGHHSDVNGIISAQDASWNSRCDQHVKALREVLDLDTDGSCSDEHVIAETLRFIKKHARNVQRSTASRKAVL